MLTNSKANIILIAGGSGLIGRGLINYLLSLNYQIRILSRKPRTIKDVECYLWNPAEGTIDHNALALNPIIINLAGEGIADKYWTNKRKQEILSSRINSTRTLASGLRASGLKPKLIIQASAIGIYGDRPSEVLVEDSITQSNNFLSSTVSEWENSSHPLKELSERLIIIRTGLVLSQHGGIWPKFLLTKFLRTFNWFGNGRQMYSWIHINDLINAIEFIINQEQLDSIVNLTAPLPCSNKEIIQTIQNNIEKSTISFGIPAFVIKLFLRDMSSMLLDTQFVLPKKLLDNGFTFEYKSISQAVIKLMSNK